jgi:hypothetical protein
MEVSGQLHVLAALPPRKESSDRRLGGPQNRSWHRGEKNSQPLAGLEIPIMQPIAQRYTTKLSRLFHSSYIFNNIQTQFVKIDGKRDENFQNLTSWSKNVIQVYFYSITCLSRLGLIQW